jgi:hypothetical protein
MSPDDPSTTTDRPPVIDRGPELVVELDSGVERLIPGQATAPPGEVVHVTRLDEQGPFVVASCTCGWRSYARRSRPLARSEAYDHELLHSGA